MASNDIDFAEFHVLVVSNAPKKYRLVMRQISNAGMTASAMSSIKKALTYVVAKKPTHLFMSANMPKMNAVKVAKLLSTTFNIPVIIYPEDFGYKTTKFLKDCGWPNVMTSTLSGASVMNMLRIMQLREQQAEAGEEPSQAPVDASSMPEADEGGESLYGKKARRNFEEDDSDEGLYGRKKKKRRKMTEEEKQEYYAEKAKRKRPEFFDSDDDEDVYSRRKKSRRASQDDHEYEDYDDEYEEYDDDEGFDSVQSKARRSKKSSRGSSEEYDDEYYDDEYEDDDLSSAGKSRRRKRKSGEYDDDFELEDEYEEVDYYAAEEDDYDYEEYDQEYEDEEGELRTRRAKRRRRKRKKSRASEESYSEEEFDEEGDDFFIDDDDEEDEDMDLASLMRNALTQKKEQEDAEEQSIAKAKKTSSKESDDEDEYDDEDVASKGRKKRKKSESASDIDDFDEADENDDDEFEYEDEDERADSESTGRKSKKRRKKKTKGSSRSGEGSLESEDEYDEEDDEEDSDQPDDLAEYRRKKRRKKKSGQEIEDTVDSQLEREEASYAGEAESHFEEDEYEYEDDDEDRDFEDSASSGKRKSKSRKKKSKTRKHLSKRNSKDDEFDEEDEDDFDDIIRKSEDPDAIKKNFDEEQVLDSSALREKKEENPDYSNLKPKKSYSIESHTEESVKSRSKDQNLEEMLDPSKASDTSDWDELSKEEKRNRDLKTFEGAIAKAIDSLSTEGDPLKVDTSSTRSLVIFAVTSENFNGYLALAAGKDNIVSTELSGPFRKRLLQALRKEGLFLELLDPFYIVTDTMSYISMMKKTAVITHLTSHMGEEVGVSFLEVDPSFFEAKYTKSDDQGMYRVNIDSIQPDEPVSIDYYIQLKHNKKFIKYVPQGGTFDAEQLERLKKHKVENLCIEDDKVRKWRETTASNFFNSQIKKKA